MRDFGVAHVFDRDEQEHFALLGRQLGQGRFEVADLERCTLYSGDAHFGSIVVELRVIAVSAHLIDVNVVHHREQPGAQVRAGPPEMELVPRPFQRVLHEIVGARAIAHQRARVAAQARNEFDDALAVIHRCDYRSLGDLLPRQQSRWHVYSATAVGFKTDRRTRETPLTTLIFGGAGFVGLNIAQALLEQERSVVLFDRSPPPRTALAALGALGSLGVLSGDVRDTAAVRDAFAVAAKDGPPDVVFGAAITADDKRDSEEPELVLETNLLSLAGVMRAAREVHARRIVNLSSVAAYGDSMFGEAALLEDATCAEPRGLYALTKFASERLLDRLASLWGLDALSVRLSGVFGPWERPTGARDTLSPFFQMLQLAQAGTPAVLARAGLRDWTYAPDAAQAVCALLSAVRPAARLYNVSGCRQFSLLEWGERLASLRPGFECRLARAGEASNVDLHGERDRAPLSGARIAGELGVQAHYDCALSVTHLHAWLRQHAEFQAAG